MLAKLLVPRERGFKTNTLAGCRRGATPTSNRTTGSICVVASDTGLGPADNALGPPPGRNRRGGLLAYNLAVKPQNTRRVSILGAGILRAYRAYTRTLVMSVRKHTDVGRNDGGCLGMNVVAQDARACGGEWYPESW